MHTFEREILDPVNGRDGATLVRVLRKFLLRTVVGEDTMNPPLVPGFCGSEKTHIVNVMAKSGIRYDKRRTRNHARGTNDIA